MAGDEAPTQKVEAVVEAVMAEEPAAAVEEPIDISKPVARPDKAEFEKAVLQLNDEVAVYNQQLAALDVKIGEAKSDGGGQSDELKEARAAMKVLRDRKDVVMRDRAEVAALQKAAKASLEVKISANKSLRSELKFSSAEEIEKKIMELEKKQSTTSMSLKDEKILLKDIETLKTSKKSVQLLTNNNDSISSERKATSTISEQLTSKNAELDILKKSMDAAKATLESLNSENSERRAVLPALFKEKDALRKDKLAKVETIKALRNDFRALEKKFYDHQREKFRQQKEAREAEGSARKAEIDAKKAEIEAEELKRVPYTEEQELCKFLVQHLEKAYVAAAKADAVEEAPVAVEFEGLTLAGKRGGKDDVDDYISLNAQSGKKKGRGKKKGGLKVQEKINLVPETMEIFGLLSLEPPLTVSAVPDTVVALKAKQVWYSTLARGAVPSIRDKLKKSEERAPRDTDDKPKEAKAPKQAKQFDAAAPAAKDELFPAMPRSTAPKKVAPPAAEPVAEEKAAE
mmetsp:Transcript_14335/g.47903  ORF Transcript_14335/g.47903 Transcript_14335/m.47903 type:complete len:516 (-) Transcript_14335:203-1750(-)|eukprot:CAMPEP_0184081284 /NCGR_PEP_ID=MMETSP0974-20121125/2627_1 /TAXON_ID=483370 /ORGANISM="non described non described, Strain CCMP2097" /LENGTH=515 /DNA_ID=CAMNT_0026383955 /DNA_START=57 /DNA_END=1604 /DNA_ORIENTATION=-